MKKFKLKFWLSCMMIALCVGFTSCGDDEEGIDGDAKILIIGTWESAWSKGYEKEDGEEDDTWDEAYTEDVYTFKEGGSGVYEELSDGNTYTENITWSISDGNNLKIVFSDSGEKEEAIIKTLNENTAVLVIHEKYESGEFYDEITFKKR